MIIHLEKNVSGNLAETVRNVAESVNRELIFAAQISEENITESVHLIRKRLKLYRALLKLLKHRSDPDEYEAANEKLRNLGRVFSELRDAHVRDNMFDTFLTEQVFISYEDIIRKLRVENSNQCERLLRQLSANGSPFQTLADEIKQKSPAASFIEALDGSAPIEEGFISAYKKARKAYKTCFLHPSADLLHEWRKRVKDLQYQCELMPWIAESMPVNFYQDLIRLAELLGEDQDINNLISWIDSKAGVLENDERAAISSLLKSRRNNLDGMIEQLGKTLFQDEPAFVRTAHKQSISNGR